VQMSTNFEQALETINRITYNLTKAEALFHVVKARAFTNPEQAHQLFQEAYQAAFRVPACTGPSPLFVDMLCEIAKAQVLTDPVTAIDILQTALGPVAESRPSRDKARQLGRIAKTQALVNIDRALTTINLIPLQEKKVKVICHIAKTLASNNAEKANELLQKALETVNLIPSQEKKVKALCHIARTKIFTNPEQANQLFQQALDLADSIDANAMKVIALNNIAYAKTSALCDQAKKDVLTNPESTNEFFKQALAIASKDSSGLFQIKLFSKITLAMIETR
jgi:tetratricopeptide (TPR) repeat protein